MAAIIRRHPRKLVAGVGLIGASYGVVNDILPNPFRTGGVKNIEARYSAGGASKSHQTAIATGRGDHDAVVGNQETGKGIGSLHHEEHVQPQKPDPSGFDKAWNKAQYNAPKGK